MSEHISYPEGKTGNLALIYDGYVEIPKEGVYTFSLLSDDGSILKLDGQVLIEMMDCILRQSAVHKSHLLLAYISWTFPILTIMVVC